MCCFYSKWYHKFYRQKYIIIIRPKIVTIQKENEAVFEIAYEHNAGDFITIRTVGENKVLLKLTKNTI